jgi:hypothetical protein
VKLSILDVQKHLLKVLREIAATEGPEGAALLHFVDINADRQGDYLRVEVMFQRRKIWQKRIRWDGSLFENQDHHEFEVEISKVSEAMRGTLSLVAEKHHAYLESRFPGRIERVQAEFDVERYTRILRVVFKNGHKLTCDEKEVKTDEFIAKCCLFYDLPST